MRLAGTLRALKAKYAESRLNTPGGRLAQLIVLAALVLLLVEFSDPLLRAVGLGHNAGQLPPWCNEYGFCFPTAPKAFESDD